MRRPGMLLLSLIFGLGGCAAPVVVAQPGTPPAAYDGPLVLDPEQARTEVEKQAGAAGRALECRSPGRGGLNIAAGYGGEVGKTPARGLQIAIEEGNVSGPQRDWKQVRTEGDRALFVVLTGGRRTAAAVMRHGDVVGNQTGWWAESYAYCNVAEFDPEVAAEDGTQLWTDRDGRPVSTWVVVSNPGPQHCDWSATTFLGLDEGSLSGHGSTYLWNPEADWVGEYVAETSRDEVALPRTATDTGYRRDGRALWLSADQKRAYVGVLGADHVEMWPRTIQPLGCI